MTQKFLLFDIDGTLLNSDGAGKIAMQSAIASFLGEGDLPGGYSFAGRTDRYIVNDLLRRGGIRPEALEKAEAVVKDAYVKNLQKTLKETLHFKVYDGVRNVLTACRGNPHMETALLTGNYHQGARLKLMHAGLWHFFSWGVFGDISEDRADLAREAIALLDSRNGRVNPRDVFVIGDTANDVRCGKAVQATTVAIVSEFESIEKIRTQNPDHIVSSFHELFQVLEL